jgi:hypothetical protein
VPHAAPVHAALVRDAYVRRFLLASATVSFPAAATAPLEELLAHIDVARNFASEVSESDTAKRLIPGGEFILDVTSEIESSVVSVIKCCGRW